MADEILTAGIADLKTAETLSSEFLYLQANRGSLPQHPALMYAGDVKGGTSLTKKISELGLMGYDLPTAMAEGASVSNTPLTDGSVTVTVGRYSKAYEAGDFAKMVDANGLLKPAMFAMDAVASHAALLVSIIANLTDGFTATVGASGSNFTFANHIAAIGTLEVANVDGPYLAIYHTQQISDLRADLLAATGTIQWDPASLEQMKILGKGYRGLINSVAVFSTGHVPTANAGADRAGGMFGRGAIVWADGSIENEGDPNQLLIGGGKVLLERERTGRAQLTAYISHYPLGASMGQDEAGVSVITDA